MTYPWTDDEKKKNVLWPALDTEDAAKVALRYGVFAASTVGGITGLAAGWAIATNQKAFNLIGAAGFIDAAIFLAIAVGIYKRSRIAALAGLLLFLLEKASQIHQTGRFDGAWMAIPLIYCFVLAVRGAFALHRNGQQAQKIKNESDGRGV